MSTPDLTPAQLLAVVKAAVAVAVAFSVPLTSTQQISLLSLAGALSAALVAADAAIRRARAQHLAAPIADQQAAQALAALQARRTADQLATEAQAEQAAQAANDAGETAQPADGVDPATLG